MNNLLEGLAIRNLMLSTSKIEQPNNLDFPTFCKAGINNINVSETQQEEKGNYDGYGAWIPATSYTVKHLEILFTSKEAAEAFKESLISSHVDSREIHFSFFNSKLRIWMGSTLNGFDRNLKEYHGPHHAAQIMKILCAGEDKNLQEEIEKLFKRNFRI